MNIRLTQTVQKGGCAAKISAEVLREVLGKIDFSSKDSNVLIDGRDFDDAGIYRINDDLALVQTLDFFTPIVDSPYLFGQIAAVNALSDVYAMGGTPKTCMAILAFPLATLDPEIMGEVLRGANDKIKEAEASMVGGHSIDDDTLKFGLSVTGLVNPKKMWANSTAKPDDVLILTKALGTGTLTAGLKNSDYSEVEIADAIHSMCQLNKIIDLLSDEQLNAIHAATDVTGFGLMGHGLQMAKASNVTLQIKFSNLPILPKAIESIQADNLTKAHRSNLSYTKEHFVITAQMLSEKQQILFDPQTSGGLLLSVDAKQANEILAALQKRFLRAEIIGTVSKLQSKYIEVLD